MAITDRDTVASGEIRYTTARAADALNIRMGANVPMVMIKERGIKRPVPLNEVASGMQ